MTFVTLWLLTAGPDLCTIPYPGAGSYITATAVVPKSTPNAQQVAADDARRNLRQRLCNEADCSSLEPSIREWKAGAAADSICAGAAIEQQDYEAWKTRRAGAEAAFKQALALEVTKLAERLKPLVRKGPVMVALQDVFDDGTIGGARSRWARLAVQEALGAASVVLAGEKPPASVARLRVEVITVDQSQSRLQLSLEAGSGVFPGALLPFSADLAPRGGRARNLLRQDKRLRLSVETKQGDLCDGMATRLWLESDRKRCVVVLDAWGDDAMLLFPNKARPSCEVPGGVPVAASGEKPFRVVALPGVDEERYVALAADRLDQLPPAIQAMVKGLPASESCQLSETARGLLDAEAPPSQPRTELRFRLMDRGPACEGIERLSEAERNEYADALGQLPQCP